MSIATWRDTYYGFHADQNMVLAHMQDMGIQAVYPRQDAGKRALGNAHPIIMNSDQGGRFTSPKYTELFLAAGSKISMDHRGRAYGNIFIERSGEV